MPSWRSICACTQHMQQHAQQQSSKPGPKPPPQVLGTPDLEVLAKFKQNGAAHVNFDFPQQKGIGIAQLIPHASPECVDLMMKMLAYDASERITAREALRHPYFREVRVSSRRPARCVRKCA